MILCNDGLQIILIDMGVNFSSRNTFVAKHILYCTQIRSAFYQMGSKRVTESMGTNRFCQAYSLCEILYNKKYHDTRQLFSSSIQKHDVFMPRLYRNMRTHFRSEEHTSELQSRENLVCRLLL